MWEKAWRIHEHVYMILWLVYQIFIYNNEQNSKTLLLLFKYLSTNSKAVALKAAYS